MSNSTPIRSTAPPAAAPAGGDWEQVETARLEIRQLVQEIARLAQQDLSPPEFYHGFLARVVSALAAVGGAVWEPQGESLRLAFQIDAPWSPENLATAGPPHLPHLDRVVATTQALIIPPKSGGQGEPFTNPTPHLLLLAPLVCDGQCLGVVEIVQRAGGGPAAQRGYLRFLVQMCDLAADYLKTRRLRMLEERDQFNRRSAALLLQLQRAVELPEVAYTVANEGRRLVGCDRLSLLTSEHAAAVVQAVSGLDALDRRAAQVQRLETLVAAVIRGQTALDYPASRELPPQLAGPLAAYLDLSHARALAIRPLYDLPAVDEDAAVPAQPGLAPRAAAAPPLGALAFEQLHDEVFSESAQHQISQLANHAAAALARANEYRRLPFWPLWRALDRTGWRSLRGWTRTLAVAGLAAAVLFTLAVIPARREAAARGKLQPAVRRALFAPLDAVVEQVHVRHGQAVRAGDVLLELSQHELREQWTTLIGRRETTRERISALERALLSGKGGAERLTAADEQRLSGELFELRQEAENHERELTLFREKEAQLKVVAPAAGQVLTWKAEELLARRPVQRGQVLLTLADPAGPWELELLAPERRLAHLLRGGQRAEGLPVVFTLASHPGREFHGRVRELEQTAEVRGGEGNTIRLVVPLAPGELPELHDQVTVQARIDCGPASLAAVWFGDLLETVQTRVLFWW